MDVSRYRTFAKSHLGELRKNHYSFAIRHKHVSFNIKGNNYRLVVVIQFVHGYIYIRFVGTHAEYDKTDCKTI